MKEICQISSLNAIQLDMTWWPSKKFNSKDSEISIDGKLFQIVAKSETTVNGKRFVKHFALPQLDTTYFVSTVKIPEALKDKFVCSNNLRTRVIDEKDNELELHMVQGYQQFGLVILKMGLFQRLTDGRHAELQKMMRLAKMIPLHHVWSFILVEKWNFPQKEGNSGKEG